MTKMLKGVARGFQLVLSVIVLGLSITLTKTTHHGSVPSQTGYAVFAGAFATFGAVGGIIALFLDTIPSIFSIVLDIIAAHAVLIAGIVYAVTLKGVSCSSFTKDSARNDDKIWHNKILSGGCDKSCWWQDYVIFGLKSASDVQGNCRSAQADMVFMFLSFAACTGVVVATFLSRRS